jgi:hypothetical protein
MCPCNYIYSNINISKIEVKPFAEPEVANAHESCGNDLKRLKTERARNLDDLTCDII